MDEGDSLPPHSINMYKHKIKIIMKKSLKFIKKIFTIVKNWIVANGIEGVLGLIVGLILWSFGYKIYAGFAFGVFATRNWDLAKNWVKGLLRK